MEFNVLGHVTVVDGSKSLNIGGPKQRTVLAMLIANHGRPVSNDVIAAAVYGDDATPRNRRNVQTYVSTLRSVIGDVIVKQGKGWHLDVDSSQIDALRFEDLCDAARGSEAAGQILREALALWMGHPYQDIEANGRLDAEVTRLNEMRVAAQAARIDADLESGRHADLIGEIEGLLIEHSYSEVFRAQHMLALYRAGRQKEALRSYESMRSLLVEELGVDPNPELQDLEQRILDQDESLRLQPGTQISKKAVLVVDAGDPIELARLPAPQRERLLRSSTETLRSIVDGSLIPAGSATSALFDDISAAAGAAASVAEGSGSQLRVALDFGDVEVSETGATGVPVSRAAVLVSVAHHGQVLLSAEAQQAVVSNGDDEGLRFESLGRHDLVGIEEPASVYQLLLGDPPVTFPQLDTDNVPVPLPEGGNRSVPGYELREPVGDGTIGTLYRAYQPSMGREVLIEVIGRAESSDPDFIRRFEADAQRLALLDHPNVNPIVDYWRETEGAFLVYPWHRGGFLERANGTTLTQIGSALSYAHSYGLVHGSLRPDRIALDEGGNAYLMGFPVGGVLGNSSPEYPAYIPPEALAGDPPSIATDIYSFAVLAHEAQTGVASGDQALRPESEVLARALSENPADRPADLADLLAHVVTVDGEGPDARLTQTRNPYKGLAAFHESDADDFYGRTNATAQLTRALEASSFIAVVGPSGIGKSSVVRAGLTHALRRGVIAGSEKWLITTILPGSHPFLELERALDRVAVDLPGAVRERFAERDPSSLENLDGVLPAGTELLILVDQFEELFTMTPTPVVSAFLELLTNATHGNQVRIVVTLRADFLDRPLAYSDFGQLLGDHMVTLSAPTPEELVSAITTPSERMGVVIDAGLVGRMVAEVHDRPGALPLLQHTLSELFDTRLSDLIGVDIYEAVGGVGGSLANRAEAIFGTFDDEQKTAIRQTFLRLVAVLEDTAPTRTRVRVDQLSDLDSANLVESFTRSRLLVADTDPETRTPTIEIAHEALITHWPRLAGWIDAAREDLTLRRRLDEAVHEWEENGREDSYLLTGGRLAQHLAWTSETTLTLTRRQTDFLELSQQRDQQERGRRRRRRIGIIGGFAAAAVVATLFGVFGLQQADEADAQRQQAQARSLLSASTAQISQDPGLALPLAIRGVSLGSDGPQGVAVLREALSAERTTYYHEIPKGALGVNNFGEMSPDGRHLLVGVDANTVELRDIETDEVVWTYDAGVSETGFIRTRAVFVNDGNEVAVSVTWEPEKSDPSLEPPPNQGIVVLDRETGEQLRQINHWACGATLHPWHPSFGDSYVAVQAITDEWSATHSCTLDRDTGVLMGQEFLVDVETGASTPVGPVGDLNLGFQQFGFAPSVGLLARWDRLGKAITVTHMASGEVVAEIADSLLSENVALSPDGSLLVVGGTQENDQTELRVYDVSTAEQVAILEGHGGSTNALRFIAGGSQLLSAGDDGLVKVWDPISGDLLETIVTGEGIKHAISLNDEETRLAVYGSTATVVALDPAATSEVGVLDSCGDQPTFHAGAGLVVRGRKALVFAGCVNEDGVFDPDPFHIFDLETQSQLLTGLGGATQGVDLSPDGRYIAGQTWTPPTESDPGVVGPVVVTDTETGLSVQMDGLCEWFDTPAMQGPDCVDPSAMPYAAYGIDIDFSPDGGMVSMSERSRRPGRVWDATSGVSLGSWVFQQGEFTHDGTRFVSINWIDRVIEVRDAADFSVIASRTLEDGEPAFGMFRITSDDETIVGIDGIDGNGLVFYDIETLTLQKVVPNLHESFIRHLEISENGAMIATAGRDGFAKVWDLETGELLHEIHASEDDRVQAVEFADGDNHLLVAVGGGPLAIYTLDVDELLAVARGRLTRGFNETECALYFPDTDCPTLEEMKAG